MKLYLTGLSGSERLKTSVLRNIFGPLIEKLRKVKKFMTRVFIICNIHHICYDSKIKGDDASNMHGRDEVRIILVEKPFGENSYELYGYMIILKWFLIMYDEIVDWINLTRNTRATDYCEHGHELPV